MLVVDESAADLPAMDRSAAGLPAVDILAIDIPTDIDRSFLSHI